MVTITDITTKNQEHWKVDDGAGNVVEVPYYAADITGYDRVRVLRQIVDLHTALYGYKTKQWSQQGKVFTLE